MSNLVLYRKYRPQKFSDVISQEHVKTTLANAVVNNRAGHAYLFTGPRGVGKTTIARIFARAVNCPNQKIGEPCNECAICKSFLGSTSLDIIEIDAASHTGVDNIREIIDHLRFAPTNATFKVIIIDEVHMLSKGAFNALLKTLEEPPKHAIFILATTEVHKVPATIVSRTQRFDFKKVTLADLINLLKRVLDDVGIKATDEALIMIAQAADGSFRDSLSLLDQVISFSQDKITPELIEQILGLTSSKTVNEFLNIILDNDTKAGLKFVSKLVYSGTDLYQFHKDFLEYLRRVMLIKLGSFTHSDFTDNSKKALEEVSQKISNERLMNIIEIFQKAGSDFRISPIQSLPLELAVVESTQNHDNNNDDNDGKPQENVARRFIGSKPELINEHATGQSQNQLDQIKQHWPQILEKVKEYNHSLISSMKLAVPESMQGKELVLVFPYKFHKDAIENRKNRIVIDQVIEDVTGLKVLVKPVLQQDSKSENNTVESALKILGGEVDNK